MQGEIRVSGEKAAAGLATFEWSKIVLEQVGFSQAPTYLDRNYHPALV
jgi:hypothetical protein